MAQIEVSAEYNLAEIAEAAGSSNVDERCYVDGFLIVENVTQQALDDALSNYDHSVTTNKIFEANIESYRAAVESAQISVPSVSVLDSEDEPTTATITITNNEATNNSLSKIEKYFIANYANEAVTHISFEDDTGTWFKLTSAGNSQLIAKLTEHGQKTWAAKRTVIETHAQTPYATLDAAKTAFDNIMNPP